MRTALVHDWLTGMRGGEWVLQEIASLFPGAPIFTLVHQRGAVSAALEAHPIHTSFLQRAPAGARRWRSYLPLMPLAAESFNLRGFDLVISSSHCVAKGVRPAPGACHISYVHTPMRYVWDLYRDYARGRGPLVRAGMALGAAVLRRWDVSSAARVSHFLANSRTVARRIAEAYERPADVIPPPVDTEFFRPADQAGGVAGASADQAGGVAGSSAGDYYLLVTALVPYKRVDLAVAACRRLGRRLLIVGSGPEEPKLRRLAAGARAASGAPLVEFLGWQPREGVRDLYRGARALLFPGLEDFGMAPVESLACGRPVVAYGAGGATETLRGPVVGPAGPTGEEMGRGPGMTGVFFRPQSAEALVSAMETFEGLGFDRSVLRERAEEFDRAVFRRHFREVVGRFAGVRWEAEEAPARVRAPAGAPGDRATSEEERTCAVKAGS